MLANIKSVKKLNSISHADVKIAVLHHPLDWLSESYKIKSILLKNFDFILNGHQHTPRIKIESSTLGECILISTGLGFSKIATEDPLDLNAYNFVHLDFYAGKGAIFPRRWNSAQMRWTMDMDNFNSEVIRFSLPSANEKEKRNKKHT